MKKRILTIDGNYFAMRCLGTLNMNDRINNLETKNEKESFLASMNTQLISLYTAFQPFITNVIFCTDNKSWRKEIPPHKPYFVDDTTLIGYKEQRKEKKEASSINYDNFYTLYREFIENIKTKMIVFDIEGLEGDDLLMLISNKFSGNKDLEIVTFCTDGDLMQIVKDNSILMRNIKSGDAPFGEFVLTLSKYKEIYDLDAKSILLGSSIENNDYRRMINMNLFGNSPVIRTLNKGISIATPFKVALIKSICGDKKDNLFSLMSWKSTTGNINYKITEKHIVKALNFYGLDLSENACQQILSNKDLLSNLIVTLRNICKQEHIELKELGKHLKHNLQMNVLNRLNIPEKYLEKFDFAWTQFEKEIIETTFDASLLKTLNVHQKDNATNIMLQSIPNIVDILN